MAGASLRAQEGGGDLIAILESEEPEAIDWESVRDPRNWLGAVDELIDRALGAVPQP